ncbi:MAG: ferredoxin [Patescibacteria group bacterium]|nr:ferredoxin [Patescibacteria group bacterium]
MSQKIIIDREMCVGCGACANLCPEVFELQDDGKAKVINENGCQNCDCDLVVNTCPVGVIKIKK